jgi:septal ring factor EnvC (AmiA/AmiB activator)
VTAPLRKQGPLTWMQRAGAKYLGRRALPAPPPASTDDLVDGAREHARAVVSALATIGHRLDLSEDANQALRDRVRSLEAENARLGDELSAALSAGTRASATLSRVALEIESFEPHFWRAELYQAADWAKQVVPEMLRDAGVDVAVDGNAAVTKEGAQ